MIYILAAMGFTCICMILISILRILREPQQHCYVYCPKCKNELVSSNSLEWDNGWMVKYRCDICGEVSFWDFARFPVPYLLTCAKDCKHFWEDNFGYPNCDYEGECSPDTMVRFELHGEVGE